MFRVRALGTGTIAFSPARSCSGYLVEAGDVRLLMDCGSGITRRLAEMELAWQTITHVALTHFHIDHHADLPSLVFALKYGMLPARSAPLEIVGPIGTKSLMERLAAAYGEWLLAPGFTVTVRELEPGTLHDLGGVGLVPFKVPHTAESVAYSITRAGRRVVYTGDTGVSPELGVWARDCDLLIAECSLPANMAMAEHLTPEQVGELGLAARPRMLALTHFYPPVERVDIAAEVRRHYTGPLTLAHDGWVTEIEER
jgi:ribonuclease BN (tRNA processing enzyme)